MERLRAGLTPMIDTDQVPADVVTGHVNMAAAFSVSAAGLLEDVVNGHVEKTKI